MEKVNKSNWKRKIALIILIILVVIISIFFLLIPRINLKGKTTVMLNINSEYHSHLYFLPF